MEAARPHGGGLRHDDVTKARVALKRLPLLKRGKAKKACKKLGVSL